MGNWLIRKAEELVAFSKHGPNPKGVFHLLTTTLLSLLLPLSFLLLATLSGAQYYLQSEITILPFPFTLALKINPCILYFLVSMVSIATLIHVLMGNANYNNTLPREPYSDNNTTAVAAAVLRSHLYLAWILLCAFQVCVGLGIEGSIAAGVYDDDGYRSSFAGGGAENRRSLLSRVVFLLGLHETTMVWSRLVVRPVVDDTVFVGGRRKERWVERVAVAASVGTLWWWRLREEVETLVVMAEVKREESMDVGIGDFVGWWLYYVTVTIGMVRVVKGVMWVLMVSLCRGRATQISQVVESSENDDKV